VQIPVLNLSYMKVNVLLNWHICSGVAAIAIDPQRWQLMWFPSFTAPEVVGDFVVVASLKISQFIQLER
jgi:hypothetical protein